MNRRRKRGSGHSKCYYGIKTTAITEFLRPTVPKHDGHPSLRDAPRPYFGKEGTNVTEMLTFMSRGRKPPSRDKYFGREITDVSAYRRKVPPAPFDDSKPRPYFGRPQTYVTDPSKPIDCGPEVPGRKSRTEQRQPIGKITPCPWTFVQPEAATHKIQITNTTTPAPSPCPLPPMEEIESEIHTGSLRWSPGPVSLNSAAIKAAKTLNEARDKLQTSLGARPRKQMPPREVTSSPVAEHFSSSRKTITECQENIGDAIAAPAAGKKTRHCDLPTVQWNDDQNSEDGSSTTKTRLRSPPPSRNSWFDDVETRGSSAGSDRHRSPSSSQVSRTSTSQEREKTACLSKTGSSCAGSERSKLAVPSTLSTSPKLPHYPPHILNEPAHFEAPYFGKRKTDVTDPRVSTRNSENAIRSSTDQENNPDAKMVVGKSGVTSESHCKLGTSAKSPLKEDHNNKNQCARGQADNSGPPWFGRIKSYVTDPSVSPNLTPPNKGQRGGTLQI